MGVANVLVFSPAPGCGPFLTPHTSLLSCSLVPAHPDLFAYSTYVAVRGQLAGVDPLFLCELVILRLSGWVAGRHLYLLSLLSSPHLAYFQHPFLFLFSWSGPEWDSGMTGSGSPLGPQARWPEAGGAGMLSSPHSTVSVDSEQEAAQARATLPHCPGIWGEHDVVVKSNYRS